MLVRHATPRRNLPSIRKGGLKTAKSKGKLKVVWVHTPGRTPWAVLHTEMRHKVQGKDIVVIEIRLPRSALKKRGKGLWYTLKDVATATFVREIELAEVVA